MINYNDSAYTRRLELALWALIDTLEGAVSAVRSRGAGGQQVPHFGDFSNVPPSIVGQMARWAKDLRGALRGEWPMTREEWVEMFPSSDQRELDYTFRRREP